MRILASIVLMCGGCGGGDPVLDPDPAPCPMLTLAPEVRSDRDLNVALSFDAQGTYAWSVDGVVVPDLTGPTVPADRTARGETWSVTFAGDACEASAHAIVVGSEPRVAEIAISPAGGDETTTFSCDATVDEVDGDPVTIDHAWFDGATMIATGPRLLPGSFTAGQAIHCEATPYDLDGAGAKLASAAITGIADNATTTLVSSTSPTAFTTPSGGLVDVPAGALAVPTMITGGTIALPSTTELPPDRLPLAAIAMYPEGLVFATPIAIGVPLAAPGRAGEQLVVYTRDQTGMLVPATLTTGEAIVAVIGSDPSIAVFSTDHFSDYVLTRYTRFDLLIPFWSADVFTNGAGNDVYTLLPEGTTLDPALLTAMHLSITRQAIWREILYDLIVETDDQRLSALPCFAQKAIDAFTAPVQVLDETSALVDAAKFTTPGARYLRDAVLHMDKHTTFRNVRTQNVPYFDDLDSALQVLDVAGASLRVMTNITRAWLMQTLYRNVIEARLAAMQSLVDQAIADASDISRDTDFVAAWAATRTRIEAEVDPIHAATWDNITATAHLADPLITMFRDAAISYLFKLAAVGLGSTGWVILPLQWAIGDAVEINHQQIRQQLRATLEGFVLSGVDPEQLALEPRDTSDAAQGRRATIAMLRLYNARSYFEDNRRFFAEVPLNLLSRSILLFVDNLSTDLRVIFGSDSKSMRQRAIEESTARRVDLDAVYARVQYYLGIPGMLQNGTCTTSDDFDGDGFAAPADCNDLATEVHPVSGDVVGGIYDQNCDGTDGIDADRDGHASISSGGDDCDDDASTIHPGAPDVCGDGIAQDCQADYSCCGNTTCDNGETPVNCPRDCGATSGWVKVLDTGTKVTAVLVDPTRPNVVYAGTGDSGQRVWKSVDGGATFAKLSSFPASTVGPIAVDANGVVFVGAGDGLYRSSDGGVSWSRDLNLGSFEVRALAMSLDRPGTIYAGNAVLYKTVDDGAVWTTTAVTTKAVSVAIDPANSNHVMVAAGTQGLFNSFDGLASITPATGYQSGASVIAFADYVHLGTELRGMWVSYNGGYNFSETPGVPGFGVNAIVRTDAGLYSGNWFGGVYVSTNNGQSWTQVNNGLTQRDVMALAWTSSSGTLFAGTQNGLFATTNGGQ